MNQARTSRRGSATLAALAVCIATPTGEARAQGVEGLLNQRFWVQLSAYRLDVDTTLRIDDPPAGIRGSDLDFESGLGMPERKTLGALLLGARLGERWRGEFEYFSLERGASRFPTSRTFVVEDTTYQADALVDSEFESKVARLSLGYSLLRTPAAEAGLVVGLHVTRFAFSIAGQGSVGGSPAALRREAVDGTVPLPTIGAYGTWAFAQHWAANARIDLFSLEHKGYEGRLVNAQANVLYRFTPNLGFGIGYRYGDYKVDANRGDFTGRIDYRFNGPQLFVEAGF